MSEDEQDRRCVQRCLDGEAEAFGDILDRYEKPVYNLVVRLGADREEARDICQQVFDKEVLRDLGVKTMLVRIYENTDAIGRQADNDADAA